MRTLTYWNAYVEASRRRGYYLHLYKNRLRYMRAARQVKTFGAKITRRLEAEGEAE